MPYNNTPIAPTQEVTGTVALPLARVKKIIATDDDISNCSNNAAFMITVAAEMFLHHLVEQSYNIVKSEKKPRRNIQYRDIANAVARVENLEFLTDVVPKTTTYKVHKQSKGRQPAETGVEGADPTDPAAAPQPNERAPGNQMSIQDSMAGGRTVPIEAPKTAYPQVVIPTSEVEQARDGASRDVGGEEMDVDEAAGSRPGTGVGGKREEV